MNPKRNIGESFTQTANLLATSPNMSKDHLEVSDKMQFPVM